LEIIESIETLKCNGPKDLTDLSLHLAGGMIHIAGLAKSHSGGIRQAKAALKSGEALKVFREMIKRQGGNPKVVDDYSLLPTAPHYHVVTASRAGYIKKMNATEIGLEVVSLGGGRHKSTDEIDFGVGLTFHKKVGDKVKEGDPIVTIHHNEDQKAEVSRIADELIHKDISFSPKKPAKLPSLIYETETSWCH
jgi:thymidine phosphorylase